MGIVYYIKKYFLEPYNLANEEAYKGSVITKYFSRYLYQSKTPTFCIGKIWPHKLK